MLPAFYSDTTINGTSVVAQLKQRTAAGGFRIRSVNSLLAVKLR
jgi:hypothetical protein